jgi:nucleoside-diphosphate-sugar epimerase
LVSLDPAGRAVYTLHILGDADAAVDFTHIDNLAAFVVFTIDSPDVAGNKSLNIVSDRISYNELTTLLEKYSKKK